MNTGERDAAGATTESDLEVSLREHALRFQRRFGGGTGSRMFFSPGRVNLLGAHLDYNGGPVMPMAIDRGTFLAVRGRTDGALRLASTLEEEGFEGELDRLPRTSVGAWFDYPLGVVRSLLPHVPGLRGADVLVGGNLPIGAGLSSSASICVGTAYALMATAGVEPDLTRCIEAALWGEREFVGVKCGIMDPYAVALTRPGHLLWLDCADASVEHLPLDTSRIAVGVVDTGIRRELAHVAFNERVAQCGEAFERLLPFAPGARFLRDVSLDVVEAHAGELTPPQLRRALHVATEVRRAFAAREALRAGDLAAFGRSIRESHESLRDLYEVSIPELDFLVARACAVEGVLGARLTGAGFGGCVVLVALVEARQALAVHLEQAYQEAFGRSTRVAFYAGAGGPREVG